MLCKPVNLHHIIKSFKKLALAFLLFFSCLSILGQSREIIFDQIQQKDEVLYDVSSLIQDHNGFIWFITGGKQAIMRYDGYEFISYLDTEGIFRSIMEDRKGLLWLGTPMGITIFNPENEKSIQYLPDPDTLQIPDSPNNIVKIVEDKSGIIWCATGNGLLKMEPKSGIETDLKDEIFNKGLGSAFDISLLVFHQADSIEGINQINEIYIDSQQRLWIGGTGSLFLLYGETNEYIRMDLDAFGRSRLSSPYIRSILEENTDVFWIGTGDGLYRISNVRNSLAEPGINTHLLEFRKYLEMKLITGLLMDNQNRLWIGTNLYGLIEMKYNAAGIPEFREVYKNLYEPEGEGIRTIWSLMKDQTGLIWTGHEYGGIRKFHPEGNHFITYNEIINQYFSNYNINTIMKDEEGNLWIGTYGDGLHKIGKNGIVSNYSIMDDTIPDISGNAVMSLVQIDNGIFWIGAINGIWEFNTITGKSRKLFTQTVFGELYNSIRSMLKMENYVMFSLLGEGLFIYNLSTKELRQYRSDQNDPLGLRSNSINSICELANGEVLVGGGRGLNRINLNKETGELTFLPVPFSNVALEALGTINKLHQDVNGIVWCGTDNGLFELNIESGEARIWTANDGLSFDVIHSVEEDDQGGLWLGTTNGLSMLKPETGNIKIFNESNGLPVMIHNLNSSFRDTEGTLYFGGIGSFYSFHPDSIRTNTRIPPVVVTDFRMDNKPVQVGSDKKFIINTNISYTKEINLAYNQNDLSFTFAALDYSDPAQNRYTYRLEGYQEEWIETGADNRIATYTNLSPGEYTFMVRGSNNDGAWNEEGTYIDIIIRPPIWRTKIAYIAYGILFLFLLRGIIFWRTRRLRKEKMVLERQVNERTEELREVNTLLEEQKEELLYQKEELQATLENLQKTQEQLIESEKMAALGGLVAGVAHEINTPVGIGITAISNLISEVQKMAELYKKDELSHGDFKEFLQTSYDAGELIQKNLVRTASLIQSFKQVSVDQVSEQQRVFGFRDYLNDILSSLQPKFKGKQIDFNIVCDKKLELNSFPGVFAQILTNLILNSLQHGFHEKEKGIIGIQVEMNKELLRITYQDNGVGINSKDLPHIFEPFYTSDKRKGTGLGLNIVYNLVKQKLHGNISCESEPGKYTLFRIEVPAA